jgi:thiamine-phosphate pyrophosphorylase
MYSRLQYISQGNSPKEHLENIQLALDSGCEWVQLRFKNGKTKELCDLAEQVKTLCLAYNAVFIMNDYPHLAKAIDADGVHLGLSDMTVPEARAIVGTNKIIGGTANTFRDVLKRINENCDYIGLGPFRFTLTKEKLSPVIGIDGLSKIMSEIHDRKLSVPVYAIGGITLEDIPAIMKTGVAGVAVSNAITRNPDKKEWMQKFKILTNEQSYYCR